MVTKRPDQGRLWTSLGAWRWLSLGQGHVSEANLHSRTQAFSNCLKLNVSNTVLPTRPDLLFLLPPCLVSSVSTLQLHLSLRFPMAHSSHALLFGHILKAILATKSLIVQPETTSLFFVLPQYFCLWHSFNIFATQH